MGLSSSKFPLAPEFCCSKCQGTLMVSHMITNVNGKTTNIDSQIECANKCGLYVCVLHGIIDSSGCLQVISV